MSGVLGEAVLYLYGGVFASLILYPVILRVWRFSSEKVEDLFDSEEESEDDEGIYCSFCGQGPMERVEDKLEHEEAQHIDSEDDESDEEDDRSCVMTEPSSVRGELVDDYEIDWDQDDEDDGIEIQEATGSSNSTKFEHLKTYYMRVVEEIEKSGKIVIKKNTHIGKARGFNIKRKFKSAVKRHPDDSLENYEFVRDKKGSYPVIIEKAE